MNPNCPQDQNVYLRPFPFSSSAPRRPHTPQGYLHSHPNLSHASEGRNLVRSLALFGKKAQAQRKRGPILVGPRFVHLPSRGTLHIARSRVVEIFHRRQHGPRYLVIITPGTSPSLFKAFRSRTRATLIRSPRCDIPGGSRKTSGKEEAPSLGTRNGDFKALNTRAGPFMARILHDLATRDDVPG